MPFAKLSSSGQVLVKLNLNWDGLYNHCETQPPGKYIWATSTLPWELNFVMEAFFNQIMSTS